MAVVACRYGIGTRRNRRNETRKSLALEFSHHNPFFSREIEKHACGACLHHAAAAAAAVELRMALVGICLSRGK